MGLFQIVSSSIDPKNPQFTAPINVCPNVPVSFFRVLSLSLTPLIYNDAVLDAPSYLKITFIQSLFELMSVIPFK